MRSPSRSVALPLPSSPHCAPTNTMTGTWIQRLPSRTSYAGMPGYCRSLPSVGSSAVRVLLIGSGGREHALAVSLAADPAVDHLIAAPGNPGIAQVATLRPVTATDPAAVAALAVEVAADLVVIGPEAPLVAGVADAVRAKGIACFGPSAAAAQLEGSKAFAKDVMAAAGVPTARSFACSDADSVARALDELGAPYVVKND